MVILFRNKHLFITKPSNIFQYETGVDVIRFLIPKKYEDVDLSSTRCCVVVERPFVEDTTTSSSSTGSSSTTVEVHEHFINEMGVDVERIFKYFPYDMDQYNDDYLSITVPITTALTMKDGILKVWLIFLDPNDQDGGYAEYVLETNYAMFPVLPMDTLQDLTRASFDEIWYHTNLDSLEDAIKKLINVDIKDSDDDEDFSIDIDDED